MAYRRSSIVTRINLFNKQQLRLSPSFSHFSNFSCTDGEELTAKSLSRNSAYSSHFLKYNNTANSQLLSGIMRWRSNIPAGHRLIFQRNLSNLPSDIDGGDLIGEVGDKAMEAAQVVNEVASAAADSSAPVATFQYLIDYVHCYTGLEWWASIAATTLLIRFIMLPIRIEMMKHPFSVSAYMETLIEPLQTKLRELKSRNEPIDREVEAMLLSHIVKILRKLPVRYLLPITTTGILFFAISNMAVKVPSFVTGGTLWFMDLTTPDHSLRLPMLLAFTFWLRFQCNLRLLRGSMAHTVKMNLSLAGIALLFPAVTVTAGLPSAIYCSWIASNLFFMAFSIVLMDPRVRKLLRISMKPPSTPK